MILQKTERRKQLLIDISTQENLFLAQNGHCVRNHRRVLTHIRRVMAWARHEHITVISFSNICPPDRINGQSKISYTLLRNRFSFLTSDSTDLPRDLLRSHQQIIMPKRKPDPFDEPRIDRLLTEVLANEFILIGALAEEAVKLTALGLLRRGKNVTVIVDALGSYNKKEKTLTFRKLETKGATLIEARRLVGNSHLRRVGICQCESCKNFW